MFPIEFSLSYTGGIADDSEIDFYDVSHALINFQRTLALTSHLVINGSVITQAPSLKGAKILALPPEEGSWKITAIILGGMFAVGTASKDSPIGHLIYSAYDYVISESLGFHVDYDKSLGVQYDELKKTESEIPILNQSNFDSVLEKCENSVKEMHRPIIANGTATQANILSRINGHSMPTLQPLNLDTYEYIRETSVSRRPKHLIGRVTSYNTNTFKGRIYITEYQRPITFQLLESSRSLGAVNIVTRSLVMNGRDRKRKELDVGFISIEAFLVTSKSGQIKKLQIVQVKKD